MGRRSRRSAVPSENANLENELLRPVQLPSGFVSDLDDFLGPELPHDRRLFSFHEPELFQLVDQGSSPARAESRTWRGSVARSSRAIEPGALFSAGPIGVRRPDSVAVCVRRKRRKEVLHALRRVGRNSGRRRRNQWSDIKC